MYGSRKPGNEAYQIVHYWNITWDEEENEFEYTDMMEEEIDHTEIFDLISARKNDNIKFELKDDILERCKKADEMEANKIANTKRNPQMKNCVLKNIMFFFRN